MRTAVCLGNRGWRREIGALVEKQLATLLCEHDKGSAILRLLRMRVHRRTLSCVSHRELDSLRRAASLVVRSWALQSTEACTLQASICHDSWASQSPSRDGRPGQQVLGASLAD